MNSKRIRALNVCRHTMISFAICLAASFLVHCEPASAQAAAEPQPPVQVFNVQKEQVVATLPNDASFREQAAEWLRTVTRLSAKPNVETESGIVIHIPLNPPVPVNHSWITVKATELYLFIDPSKKESPRLLVFSSEGKPYVFDCPSDPEPFLKQHGLLDYLKET